MSWQKLKGLKEQRGVALQEMHNITERATAEGRNLSENEKSDFETRELLVKTTDTAIAAIDGDKSPERRSTNVASIYGSNGEDKQIFEQRDLKDYSILRAVRARLDGRSVDGLEREVSDEIAKRNNRPAQGFYFPTEIALERRDLTLTTGSSAKPTVTDAANFIQLLRNRLVLNTAGATVLTGLTGDMSIPKQTAKTSAYWVAEGSSPTEGAPTITGQVPLTPKTVGAFIDLSRKFILQSSISAEQFARNEIALAVAHAIDEGGLTGDGSGASPTGIINASGVNAVAVGTNGGAPTWAKIIEMETAIASQNADVQSMSYVFNSATRGKLKNTDKTTGGYGQFIWGDDNTVNGYRALATNALPSNLTKGTATGVCSAAIFGDFSSVFVGLWSGLDILVDPYTGGTAGTVRIIGLQDVDIKFRRAEALSTVLDFTTT